MSKKKLTEEHKNKIRIALAGRNVKNLWWNKVPKICPVTGKNHISHRKGTKHTPESIRKMKEARAKQHIVCSNETKQKIKETLLKKRKYFSELYKGSKSNLWKGGISSINLLLRMSSDYKFWREAVFKRDNFTCQCCGQIGCWLHPHHIRNFADFPDVRFAIDNGITLCSNCHIEFHKIYGKTKNNEEQLNNFLTERKNGRLGIK